MQSIATLWGSCFSTLRNPRRWVKAPGLEAYAEFIKMRWLITSKGEVKAMGRAFLQLHHNRQQDRRGSRLQRPGQAIGHGRWEGPPKEMTRMSFVSLGPDEDNRESNSARDKAGERLASLCNRLGIDETMHHTAFNVVHRSHCMDWSLNIFSTFKPSH